MISGKKAPIVKEECPFDKTITWDDGTTEHVQIGNDGFFVLDRVKRHLVGMVLGSQYPAGGEYGQFYLPSHMALWETQLAYLQSVGVRLIHVQIEYILAYMVNDTVAERVAIEAVFNLLRKYKMLVIPQISNKANYPYGNLVESEWGTFPDNVWTSPETHERWATRFINIASSYENVVAIGVENELDIKMPGATYVAGEVSVFMDFLAGVMRPKFNGPIIHKLSGTWLIEPEIKKACLDATDIGAFDCYAQTKEEMDSSLLALQTWLSNSGYPTTGWWCMELNAQDNNYELKIDNFSVDFIDSVFNHGATIAMLFISNWSINTDGQFFDNDGNPMPILEEIARAIPRLQSPKKHLTKFITVKDPLKEVKVTKVAVNRCPYDFNGWCYEHKWCNDRCMEKCKVILPKDKFKTK